MMSKSLSKGLQLFVIVAVLLLCFLSVFYIYYKPTVSWLTCSDTAEPRHAVSTEECLRVLEVGNQTQIITDCTSVREMTQANQSMSLEKEGAGNGQESEIVVLIWSWPLGYQFDLNSCEANYGIKGCLLTLDRSQLDKAHSVMFHHKDIKDDLPYLLSVSRPPRQKWVWMNMEPPIHLKKLPEADDLFNLTCSYRRDSDVWMPYGRLVEVSEKDKAFRLPKKDKLVCWIVSNWRDSYGRVVYFKEFSKHIKVDTYGRHFGTYIDYRNYSTIMSSCKFYLSFENSVFRDYISEKVYNPMRLGAVPVVLGPPRENYEEYIPKDSFIHVDDFKTPRELAEHLKLLDQNQEMYERYFAWRKDYVAKKSPFGQEHACRICDHVRRYKTFRVFKNITKWFWS
ncbi:hypothetical protein NFI96_001006 [Prochilodus magdalenae]|nr:hypothetical protein NFI96_001006 [Prochilodus magdalenae]